MMHVVELRSTNNKDIDADFVLNAKQTYIECVLNIRKIIVNAKTEDDLHSAKIEIAALLKDLNRVLLGGDGLKRSIENNAHFRSLIHFVKNLKRHIAIEFEEFIYKP